jgi:hypothetical protein
MKLAIPPNAVHSAGDSERRKRVNRGVVPKWAVIVVLSSSSVPRGQVDWVRRDAATDPAV